MTGWFSPLDRLFFADRAKTGRIVAAVKIATADRADFIHDDTSFENETCSLLCNPESKPLLCFVTVRSVKKSG
jgi:hypothetical protein